MQQFGGSGSGRRRCRVVALAAVVVLLAAVGASVPTTAVASPRAVAVGRALLSDRLQRLATASVAAASDVQQNRAVGLPATGAGRLLRADDGRLLVDLRMTRPLASATADLAAFGATVIAELPEGGYGTIAIDPARLDRLTGLAGLQSATEVLAPVVHPVTRPRRSDDPVTNVVACPTGGVSAGDSQLAADLARSTLGVTGAGVKVGILSDSFGAFPSEVTADVAAAELPGVGNPCGKTTPVTVLGDNPQGSEEGRAMVQIVHDLAPDAQLLFATGNYGEVSMADSIRALRNAGATVIVDDLTYYAENMYQDGPIAQAVNEVTASGASYYSSAANSQATAGGKDIGSYEALNYRPTTCPANIPAATATSCHDFDPGAGVDAGDVVTLPAGRTMTIAIDWSEPQNGVTTDLNAYIIDVGTGAIANVIACSCTSTDDNVTGGRAFEFITVPNTSGVAKQYRIVIGRKGTSGTPRFKMVFFRAPMTAVQWTTTTGPDVIGPTTYGHNAPLAGASVAAVPASDATVVEAFSSKGPATYCWKPVIGTAVAAAISPCKVKQIDFAATDGVMTSVPDFDPFFGTSAAAPHAAGVAALMKQKRPCSSPAQILTALRSSGRTVGTATTASVGSGLIQAVDAVNALPACGTAPGAPTSARVTSISPDGNFAAMKVSWTPPTAAGSSAVTSYNVQVMQGAGAGTQIQTVASSTASATISGIRQARLYRVRVAATNGTGGTGAFSTLSGYALAPFPTIDAFTKQQFADFAGRTPTASELSTWRSALSGGTKTAMQEIEGISTSSNWGPKVDPVTRLFYAYFQRPPDGGGLGFWSGQLRAGKSLDVVSNSFAGSSEFKNTYGSLSNLEFVNLVYQNVLGRAGDAGGVSFWTGQLNAQKKTRGQVMSGFSEANEHRVRRAGVVGTVNVLFAMLRRVPNSAELLVIGGTPDTARRESAEYALNLPQYSARL